MSDDDKEREFLDAVARRTGLSHREIAEVMREQRERDARNAEPVPPVPPTVVQTCRCGHDRHDHDMWGNGECGETVTCPCRAFSDPADPAERCIMCGTEVTPGSLIGNALANGAMPRMAEAALKSTRLYTDELGALRKRVAELEAELARSQATAAAEIERQRRLLTQSDADWRGLRSEHTAQRARIAELEALLAKVTKPPFATGSAFTDAEVKIILEAQGWRVAWNADSPGPLDNRYQLFCELRSELLEARICLECGNHTPGRTRQMRE